MPFVVPIWLWLVGGVIGLFAATHILRQPLLVLGEIVKAAVFGLIGLFVLNWIGSHFHFHVGFNFVTLLIAGMLGIPGLVLLAVLAIWFVPL